MLISPYKIMSSCQQSVEPVVKKAGKFKLLDKTEKLSVSDYQSEILPYAPEKADTFTCVTVGKDGDTNYKKYIMTFYSKEGDLLRKTFHSSDNNPVIRDYDIICGNPTPDSESKVRKITTKFFDSGVFDFKLKSSEVQKVYKDLKSSKIKLQINKNLVNGDDIFASVTEYPWISRDMKKSPTKLFAVNMRMSDGIPQITGITGENVYVKNEDKYLPYRMIFDESLKRLALSLFLLKEKGLAQLNTAVGFSKNLGKDIAAYFSEAENKLMYSTSAKNDSVKLAAHEVQHVYHFSQIGRLGKGNSNFSKKSRELFGEITNPAEKEEAMKFYVAAEKYPTIDTNYSIKQDKNYINNYLEDNANKEAERVYAEYKKSGEALGKQFCFGDI